MRYSLKTIVLLVAALSPVVVNAAPAPVVNGLVARQTTTTTGTTGSTGTTGTTGSTGGSLALVELNDGGDLEKNEKANNATSGAP